MPRSLACAALLLAGTAHLAVAASPISGWVTNPDNGHQYALLDTSSWVDAEVAAIRLGGHLATVRNQAEHEFIYQNFGSFSGPRLLWIGLHDNLAEGQYQWTSGEAIAYTAWAAGEPNNGFGDEDFTALYYPGHSQQSLWNDWGHRSLDPIGLPFGGVVEIDPAHLSLPQFSLDANSDWLTLTPEGDQTGQPIQSVGLAYEAAHPNWNSDLALDTSDWQPAQAVGSEDIWGATPAGPTYFRHVFSVDQSLSDAILLATVDDDALIYINGQLVVNDSDGHATGIGPLDITSYLTTGDNLIAIKAQNAGGPASLGFHIFAVPEPSSGSLALVTIATLLAAHQCRRRANARRWSS